MEEKFLYHIWDACHLDPKLTTVSGKEIKIEFPGQFNTQRGPDFVNAVLNINGELARGAVEIHLNSLDWRKHNHQEDHFYNSVILHAVLNHNSDTPFTQREDGGLIEILELKNQLSDDIRKILTDYTETTTNTEIRYCERLSGIDKEHLLCILTQHGKARFKGKVKRFNASLAISDFDQILYEGMMEAIGYDKNKLNMLQLAQHIPLSKLKTWKQDGMSSLEMSAILACCSGLLGKTRNKQSDELSTKLQQAYEIQPWTAVKLQIDWQLFRIRPSAHPLLRLLKLSQLLYGYLDCGLLHSLLEIIESAPRSSDDRYKRFKKLLTDNEAGELSQSVIDNVYLNIYLPVMALYASKTGNDQMEKSMLESWCGFKALPDNYLIRYMAKHLNPSQVPLVNKKSLYQQGLIDIFYRYCRYHQCNQCKQDKPC